MKETGRQLYLGGFEKEEFAAEAFDIACLKAKGSAKAKINYSIEKYAELLPYLASVSMEELVMAVRRCAHTCVLSMQPTAADIAFPSGNRKASPAARRRSAA